MIISQIISLSDCVVVLPRCLFLCVAPSGLSVGVCVRRHSRYTLEIFPAVPTPRVATENVTLWVSVTKAGGCRVSRTGRCFGSGRAHIVQVEVRVGDVTGKQVFENSKIKVMSSHWWYFFVLS